MKVYITPKELRELADWFEAVENATGPKYHPVLNIETGKGEFISHTQTKDGETVKFVYEVPYPKYK